MPTVASKPTLESTRAVGAVLWDQFARDRLRMAGMSDNLVTEAERTDAEKYEDNESYQSSQIVCSDTSNINHPANTCSTPVRNESFSNGNESADVNSTTTSRQNEADLYQSVTESIQEGDRTVYHSMSNESHDPLPINTSQAMPIMASYGKELRRIAEEFERTRERQLLKERANKVSTASQTFNNYSTESSRMLCSDKFFNICIFCSGSPHQDQQGNFPSSPQRAF